MPQQSFSTIEHPTPIDAAQIRAGLADRFGHSYPLWFEPPQSEADALAKRRAKLLRSYKPHINAGIVLAFVRGDGLDAQYRSALAFAVDNGCAIKFVPDRTAGTRQYRREIGSLLAYGIDAMNLSDHTGLVCVYVAGLERLSESARDIRRIVGQLNDIGVPVYLGNLGVILRRVRGEKLIPLDYIEALLTKSRAHGLRDALPRFSSDLAGVA